MSSDWKDGRVKLNVDILACVDRAMEELQVKRARKVGDKPSKGAVYAEAARLLLAAEGIPVREEEAGIEPIPPRPLTAAKRARRKKVAAA